MRLLDGKTLKEAVPELMRIFCQVETGKCTEAGHRTSLVLDTQDKLVGVLHDSDLFLVAANVLME
jgi:hypothetical protein